MKNITIPAWISCRTYLYGQENSRTYISNERRHTYVLLEGLASDLWKNIADGANREALEDWTKAHRCYDQLETFIEDLAAQDLIAMDGEAAIGCAEYLPINTENTSDEETKFVEEMKAWLFDNKFLGNLFFELTYRCNLKCVHCYNPKDDCGEIDFEMCKKAIDDAYEAGCFSVTFSGGESTLHSRFAELVAYARSKRISVEIFTNGLLLSQNEQLYNKILNCYPHRICLSLYSTEKEMHERVTSVAGSFEHTFGLISRLRTANVNVQIKNFLLNFNCMDCIKVKETARSIGATSVADISLIPTINGNKSTLQYELDEEQLFRLFVDPISPLYVGKTPFLREYEKIKDTSPCFGGFSGLCVSPNGEVTICVSLPLSVGNLNSSSIKNIWQSAMDKEPSSKLYEWQQVRIDDCAECYHNDYCAFCSYCPGMGYLENGYLKRSDVLCKQAKAKMRAYRYLTENELS